MTDDEVRGLLLAERARLERARATLRTERPGSSGEADVQDLNEAGAEIAEREEEAILLSGVDADLAELDAALARLASGKYGRCDRCGESIAEERLRALPATTTCVTHAGAGAAAL